MMRLVGPVRPLFGGLSQAQLGAAVRTLCVLVAVVGALMTVAGKLVVLAMAGCAWRPRRRSH